MKLAKITLLLLISLIPNSLWADFPSFGQNSEEADILHWAWQKAQRFSTISSKQGDQRLSSLPVFLLTEDELSKEACPTDPQNCRGMAALYDTTKIRILLREDLNPLKGNIEISFLIHEMVHALQHEFYSEEELFGTCERLYNTEKQAYAAQDAFLKSEGEFFRAGGALRFFNCKDEKITPSLHSPL